MVPLPASMLPACMSWHSAVRFLECPSTGGIKRAAFGDRRAKLVAAASRNRWGVIRIWTHNQNIPVAASMKSERKTVGLSDEEDSVVSDSICIKG
ncbi:hypothetical protein OAN307_63p00570 (plasmid) [Octadecabacter antarcticus 307]|uniref:Uncharacterized protein n=1 Tax=Octadecabacter antarcticus 307 TaxID=391626 RepID=M9RCD5_9RHOB|nr:hypothetical protein OAN307_63p00570 [Octadecabacter antarcticus 307]